MASPRGREMLGSLRERVAEPRDEEYNDEDYEDEPDARR